MTLRVLAHPERRCPGRARTEEPCRRPACSIPSASSRRTATRSARRRPIPRDPPAAGSATSIESGSDGWRKCYPTVLVGAEPTRPEKGVFLQKVRCARPECGRFWTIYPIWMSPHQSYQPDVVEQVVLEYASGEHQSYAATAKAWECSTSAVWLWVAWIARVACSKRILAMAGRLGVHWGSDLVPRRGGPVAAGEVVEAQAHRDESLAGRLRPGLPPPRPAGAA